MIEAPGLPATIGLALLVSVLAWAVHALPILYLVLLGIGVLLLPAGTLVAAAAALRAVDSMVQEGTAGADTSG